MRNVFDQYSQPENRLTHALGVCLDEDRALLTAFLRWIDVAPPRGKALIVDEQTLPGEPIVDRAPEERSGLPDLVIHDGESWCVLIESKIQARLTEDQLRRHEKTLRRRGFEELIVVTLTKSNEDALKGSTARTWSDLFEWLGQAGQGREWPARLRQYLRHAEGRFSREGYLVEGTLTRFDGFPFASDEAFTTGEARRLIKLVMPELKKHGTVRKLKINEEHPGRGAIKGRGAMGVWDLLVFGERGTKQPFIGYPHLTLGLHAHQCEVALTIPNGASKQVRSALGDMDPGEIAELHAEVLRLAKPLTKQGASVSAYALQRHYNSQSSPGVRDAALNFNLETTIAGRRGRVKHQAEWLELFQGLLGSKRSNIQFGYSFAIPWTVKGMGTRESLDVIASTWLALKPIMDVVRVDRKPRKK